MKEKRRKRMKEYKRERKNMKLLYLQCFPKKLLPKM
jgi:hypothetical protein